MWWDREQISLLLQVSNLHQAVQKSMQTLTAFSPKPRKVWASTFVHQRLCLFHAEMLPNHHSFNHFSGHGVEWQHRYYNLLMKLFRAGSLRESDEAGTADRLPGDGRFGPRRVRRREQQPSVSSGVRWGQSTGVGGTETKFMQRVTRIWPVRRLQPLRQPTEWTLHRYAYLVVKTTNRLTVLSVRLRWPNSWTVWNSLPNDFKQLSLPTFKCHLKTVFLSVLAHRACLRCFTKTRYISSVSLTYYYYYYYSGK